MKNESEDGYMERKKIESEDGYMERRKAVK